MKINFGNGTTVYGPGVSVNLTGNEVALAITAWLVAHRVHIYGPRTVTVNGEFCKKAHVYVDPTGFVMSPKCQRWNGRGTLDK